MQIFVVILNFNGFKNTIECINSLLDNKSKEFTLSIVVVDNNSKDNSVEEIRKKFGDKITLIENKKNLGFTGGCNEGARFALKSGANFVLFLNNDTRVDKALISNLLLPFSSDSVGGVVPKIFFEKGFEFHKSRYKKEDSGKVIWYAGGKMDWSNLIGQNLGVDEVDKGQFNIKREVDLATGCCFMVKAETLEKIGLFDDKYFLYYEDADLSERIKRNKQKIIYEPKAFLWHKNAESSGGSGSELQDYYITRNRMLFGMTYAPMRTKLALTRESFKLIVSGRKWQRIGVMDYYTGNFGKGNFNI